MRVPTYEQQVETAPLAQPQARADPSAGVAASVAGQALQAAGAFASKVWEQTTAAAATKDEADLDTAATPIMAAALAEKGEKAFAAVENARNAIEERRKQLAASQSNPTARSIFEKRSEASMLSYARSLENHLAQQTVVANKASAEAKRKSSLDAAALPGVDQAWINDRLVRDEGPLRAQADSKEDGDRIVAEHAQGLLEVAIEANLRRQDEDPAALDRARALFHGNRALLGAKGPEIEAKLLSAGLDRQAEDEAGRIQASLGSGFTEEAADPLVEAIPNVRLKDRVRTRVRDRLSAADRIKTDAVKEVWNLASGAFNRGGLRAAEGVKLPDGTKAMDWLNRNAPDLERRLKEEAENRWRRAKGDKADARREINEARAIARDEFLSLTPEEQAKEDIGLRWGARTDDVGMAYLGRLQAAAKQRVEKGEAVPLSEFVNDGMAQGFGLVGKGGAKQAKKKTAEYKAALHEAYYQFEEEKKRKPNDVEKQAIIDSLLVKSTREINWWPDAEEFGYERATRMRVEGVRPPLPQPTGPAVVERRRAPDGRLLERLSDGTIRVAQ